MLRVAKALGRNLLMRSGEEARSEWLAWGPAWVVFAVGGIGGWLTVVGGIAAVAGSAVLALALRLRLAGRRVAGLRGEEGEREVRSRRALLRLAERTWIFIVLAALGVLLAWLVEWAGGGAGLSIIVGIGIIFLSHQVLFPAAPWRQVVGQAITEAE